MPCRRQCLTNGELWQDEVAHKGTRCRSRIPLLHDGVQ